MSEERDRFNEVTFFYRVEYDDKKRPGQRIVEYIAMKGDNEFDIKSKVTVATEFRAGNRLYGGNIASFSNITATRLMDKDLSEEDPSQRNEEGFPKTIRDLCLENMLVW